jgi:hypothetical protein
LKLRCDYTATFKRTHLTSPHINDSNLTSEKRNSTNKTILVISPRSNALPINRDHRIRTNSVEIVNRNLTCTFDIEDLALAFGSDTLVRASDVVVVEEGVETSSVDEHIARVFDIEAPAVGEVVVGGIVPACIDGKRTAWCWLVVCCFGLDLSLGEVSRRTSRRY